MRPLVYAVDDSADYRLLLEYVYQHCLPTYELQLFDSGNFFVQQLETIRKPGLILLPDQLAGLPGCEVIGQIRNYPGWKYVPIIILSCAGRPDDLLACYKAGANSCLPKPPDAETMKQVMQTLCLYWFTLNRQVID